MKGITTLIEGVRVAFEALRSNKIRAGLTIIGIAIGVAVVVAMASVITGIRSGIAESFEAAGPRNFVVMPFDLTGIRISSGGDSGPPWWKNPEITDAEVRKVGALPAIRSASAAINFSIAISNGSDRVSDVQSQGTTSGWELYSAGEFVAGRNFTEVEVNEGRPVVVISDRLAEELFGAQDPIGRPVRATSGWRGVNERFQVVGVYKQAENIFAGAQPFFAMFPYTTAVRRLKARNIFAFAQILVVPRDEVRLEDAQDQVISALRSSRGLRPDEDNNFWLMQPTQLLDLFNRFTSAFFAVMLALSSVALMVGGVGVIGIMLISVTERTREIGIRKAVGANRREILLQFLVEAAALTMVGSAVGLALGGLGSWGVARFTPVPAEIPLWSIGASLLAAAFTGMLFGLLPAVRAARLDPVVALRYE
ncbi:MAG: ABC transporter permease [Gemmatimonadota bacterium]